MTTPVVKPIGSALAAIQRLRSVLEAEIIGQQALVERLLILAAGPVVRPSDLPQLAGADHATEETPDLFRCNDFQDFKARAEAMFLQQKLRENRYNVSRTAEVLGMQRSNLYKKITRYGLQTQIPDDSDES